MNGKLLKNALIFLSTFSCLEFVVKYIVAWIWYSNCGVKTSNFFLLHWKNCLLGDTFSLLRFKNQTNIAHSKIGWIFLKKKTSIPLSRSYWYNMTRFDESNHLCIFIHKRTFTFARYVHTNVLFWIQLYWILFSHETRPFNKMNKH